MNHTTGLILEGVPASGKTTLLKKLLKHPQITDRDFMTFLTYGEEITQRVLEKKHNQNQINKQDNLTLLNDIVTPLEKYRDYYQKRWREEKHCYAFILERFHITHVNYFNYLRWADVKEIDERLARLNVKLCLLTFEKGVMPERIVYTRGEQWRNYISRFGNSVEEIVNYYQKQQEIKKSLVKKSKLPALILETTEKNWDYLVKKIVNFWLV